MSVCMNGEQGSCNVTVGQCAGHLVEEINITRETDAVPVPALSSAVLVLVAVLNSLIFSVGVFGNILVITVLVKKRVYMDSTDTFLVNLALADLLTLLVCQSAALLEFYSEDTWYLGEHMCRLVPFLENMLSCGCVLSIMAISIERFYAVCHPFQAYHKMRTGALLAILSGLWIFSAAITCPFLAISSIQIALKHDGSEVPVCTSAIDVNWKRYYVVGISVGMYILPLCLLVGLYSRIIRALWQAMKKVQQLQMLSKDAETVSVWHQKRQVVFMLIAVIIMFFLCLLPLRSFGLWHVFTPIEAKIYLGHQGYTLLVWFVRALFYINSAVNPLIYNLMSSKFHRAFSKVFRAHCWCFKEGTTSLMGRKTVLTSM